VVRDNLLNKTKIFISWSGERGYGVAKALHWWLPHVIPAIDPLISEHDIEKGVLWRSKLADLLKETKFGLICLTPENQKEPWILFESGALSKDRNSLWTFLFGFEKPTDVESPPLADINHTMGNSKHDVKTLITDINKKLNEESLAEKLVFEQFEMWWPKLEACLDKIGEPEIEPEIRSSEDMIIEILSAVRSMSRKIDESSPYGSSFISSSHSHSIPVIGKSVISSGHTHGIASTEIIEGSRRGISHNHSVSGQSKDTDETKEE
jgi:hypothetical protein